jgi:hypothetical protein
MITMKNFFVMIFTAGIVLALTTGCDKNSGGGDDNGGGDYPTGGGGLVINAIVEDGDKFNDTISSVSALVEEKYAISSCKYENGKFKLTLPANVPEKYLFTMGYFDNFDEFDGTISDPNTKTTACLFVALNGDNKVVGDFFHGDIDTKTSVDYLYVDRNVTIKGKGLLEEVYDGYVYFEYDMTLKKGWNIVYFSNNRDDGNNYIYIVTTKKPSDMDFKWYYYNWYDWKAAPKNMAKPQSLFSKARNK